MTEPPKTTLPEALAQVERWCYIVLEDEHGKPVKIDGKTAKVPDAAKVQEYLKGLYECMDPDDWVQIATAYRDVMFPSSKEGKKRGRPRGMFYGMTSAERADAERKAAVKLGVWHIRYPGGCTDCGSREYAHATGGLCNRCHIALKDLGLTMKDYREAERKQKAGNETQAQT